MSVKGDAIYVNGKYQHYVKASRSEGRRAERVLSAALGRPVTVRPVIVVVNAGSFAVKVQPRGVWIESRRRIVKWLTDLPPVLGTEEIHEIFEVADDPETWLPNQARTK